MPENQTYRTSRAAGRGCIFLLGLLVAVIYQLVMSGTSQLHNESSGGRVRGKEGEDRARARKKNCLQCGQEFVGIKGLCPTCLGEDP